MDWYCITLNQTQIGAGAQNSVLSDLTTAWMHNGASDAVALFSVISTGPSGMTCDLFLSPQAAAIAPGIVKQYNASPTGAPAKPTGAATAGPFSGPSLLLGTAKAWELL